MTKLIIEGGSVSEPRVSGVGNTASHIISTLANNEKIKEQFDVKVAVAFNKVKHTEQHQFPTTVQIARIFIPGKIMNLLTKLRCLPPMNLLFGRGVYLFPNFKNWPLFSSQSITYIHDLAFLRHPEYIEEKNLRYLRKHIDEFLKRATVIVTVSNHAKEEIAQYFPQYANKVQVVYNGINTSEMYARTVNEQQAVADKYSLVRGSYFIFISNIEPRKNVDGLLESFKLFCDTFDRKHDTQLLLMGGLGWKNEATLKRMHELQGQGYQIIKPSQYIPDSDKPALITGSIGLIHPAFYEGFGLTPLEAMACGKYAAVGRNSSLPEVVGETGIYMDETSPASICEAMKQLYEKRSETNTQGVQRAKQFEWAETLKPLVEILVNAKERI